MKIRKINLILKDDEGEGALYYPLRINADLPKIAFEQTLGREMCEAADQLLKLYLKENTIGAAPPNNKYN